MLETNPENPEITTETLDTQKAREAYAEYIYTKVEKNYGLERAKIAKEEALSGAQGNMACENGADPAREAYLKWLKKIQ